MDNEDRGEIPTFCPSVPLERVTTWQELWDRLEADGLTEPAQIKDVSELCQEFFFKVELPRRMAARRATQRRSQAEDWDTLANERPRLSLWQRLWSWLRFGG